MKDGVRGHGEQTGSRGIVVWWYNGRSWWASSGVEKSREVGVGDDGWWKAVVGSTVVGGWEG